MKLRKMLQEFEELAEKMQIKIVQGKGNFKGGYCILEEKRIIVINKMNPIEQRIRSLAQAFSNMNLSQIYIKPAIRSIIEAESN